MSRKPRSRAAGNIEPAGTGDSDAAKPDNAGNSGNADDAVAGNDVAAATVDPAATGPTAEPETDSQPRRRGRPPGSGTGAKTKKASIFVNVSGVEKLLVGIHGGLAIFSGRMEWTLDTTDKIFDGQTEAEFLASSIKSVADHYGGGMFDQKTLDWANLIQCLAIVYGGRIYAIRSAPRAPKIRTATVHETAASYNPAPPRQAHRTEPPVNNLNGADDAGRVHIAGIGDVDLPDDNPLSPNYKPRWN